MFNNAAAAPAVAVSANLTPKVKAAVGLLLVLYFAGMLKLKLCQGRCFHLDGFVQFEHSVELSQAVVYIQFAGNANSKTTSS